MNALVRFTEGTFKWLDERLGIGMIFKATALHPIPRSVNWWYIFGSATLTAFIFQVVTGVFLAFVYIPSPDHAYQSLQWITYHQFFGNIIRGIHYWGASAMVLLIFIHLAAHFLTGSYKYPRELQWISGTFLLMATIVMAFTGQLLRWNQDAYWALVVGAAQAGRTPIVGAWLAQLFTAGPVIGGQTLTRFYAIHVFLVPGLMFGLIGMHLYLVIYKGISEWPVPGEPVDPKTYWAKYQEILHTDGEPYFPRGVAIDAVMALIAGAVVVILAITVGAAALGHPADPTKAANPRPDWYLIWYFALLAQAPASGEDYIIILFPAAAFIILLLMPLANKGERHYSRRPWASASVVLAAFFTLILVVQGYQAPWSPDFVGANGTGIPALPQALVSKLPSSQARAGAALMHHEACLACHMINGIGGQRGPDLSTVADRITTPQFIWRIARGGGAMPAYGNNISPTQMNELVAFLETRTAHPQQASQASTGGGAPVRASPRARKKHRR
ncbi:MAG: cytochrome b N-terminal domain-containing protein [Chloroflexota bacterium]|nr:cytochrome b N-terminal domain-containing protein [Chloroflexota bacterium]